MSQAYTAPETANIVEDVEIQGHIIDSLILPKVLDQILTRGAGFKITEIKIGQKRADQSFARIEVTAETGEALDELVLRLRQHGAETVERANVQLAKAPDAGVEPRAPAMVPTRVVPAQRMVPWVYVAAMTTE